MSPPSPGQEIQATILVPTMAGRGPLLPLSVGSILAQSVADIEVFIMGDGVDEATRGIINGMMQQDSRIRFFDNPKHERRGEPNRHVALAEAQGRIVCYLCDRDLMLPNHVETMLSLLENADFANTLVAAIEPQGTFRFPTAVDFALPADRASVFREWTDDNSIPLAFAAHTLAMYRRLPHGWRTTPDGQYTDLYMWEQFLAQPDCRAVSATTPTILYFPRYWRKELSTDQKLVELQTWRARMDAPGWKEEVLQGMLDGLALESAKRGRWLRNGFLRRPLGKIRRRIAGLFNR